MYVRRNISWRVVLRFGWSYVVAFAAWAIAVVWAHEGAESNGVNLAIPFEPLGTIGIAVAFYIGFKNNQSYDRFWEARKIWGGIVNVSRSWAVAVLGFVTGPDSGQPPGREQVSEVRRTLIYRHLAWINALRYQLRLKKPFGLRPKGSAAVYQQEHRVEELTEILETYLPENEVKRVCGTANPASQILRQQSEQLRTLKHKDSYFDDYLHVALMQHQTECFTLQGQCERIKNTPLPRQYAYFSKVFTWIFLVLLPFGLLGEFEQFEGELNWLTVPFSVVISWIFATMEMVGNNSEDPFENFINDVPMTALCRTIEIDLRQMLGETDVPEPLEPVEDILM